jgi:4-amino-4-deoxy-L-arabinose transferase-like glycosyltransferase
MATDVQTVKNAGAASRARRHLVPLGTALLAGLALRLWFIFRMAQVTGDTLVYGMFAKNVLQHGVYGFTQSVPVHPSLIRLPGYPLFLALCFLIFGVEKYTAVLVVQALLDLGTCLLLATLARRFFGSRAFWAALWLGVLCPFLANYVALPLTETLTVFTIALTFYALERWLVKVSTAQSPLNRWLVLIGVAMAASIQLRPEQGLLAATVVPAMALALWPRGGWRRALPAVVLVSALTVAPLVPWTVRNWHTFHVFQPLAPKNANDPGEVVPVGFQRWYRSWGVDFASTVTTYWPYDGEPLYVEDLPDRAFDSQAQYRETAAVIALYDLTNQPSAEVDRRFAAIAAERIDANPIRYYVALPLARLLNMMFRPRVDALPVPLEWWNFRRHPGITVFAMAYAALNLGYFVLAGAGLALLRRSQWDRTRLLVGAMLGTLVLRSLLLLTIDNSEPRYTLEFYPVLIVLAAGCLVQRRPLTENSSLIDSLRQRLRSCRSGRHSRRESAPVRCRKTARRSL